MSSVAIVHANVVLPDAVMEDAAVLVTDGGGVVKAAINLIHGPTKMGRFLMGVQARANSEGLFTYFHYADASFILTCRTPDQTGSGWAGTTGVKDMKNIDAEALTIGDFDGDGKRDLLKSVPDVLASTANFLKENGWQRGADWDPGKPNFPAIQKWNASDVYSRTVAEFASQLAGR